MQGYRTHFNSSKRKKKSEFNVRIQLLPDIIQIHRIPCREIIVYYENHTNLNKHCVRAKLTLHQVVRVFAAVR